MNLKEIRKSHNLTQEEVAKGIQTSRVNYNRYELGLVEPNIQTLISIADFFKLTVDEIIGHEVPFLINKSQFTNEQLALIETIKGLTREQCLMLDAYAHGLIKGAQERQELYEKFKRGV